MTEVTVLVIGDPHFQVNNISEMKMMVTNVLKVANKIRPDFIVCLGDILHRHETIHVTPFMQAEKFIINMSNIAPTYLLIGNHDRPNNSNFMTNEHAFNSLKNWNNIYVVDKTMMMEYKGMKFTFVPYVPIGKFYEALKDVDYMDSKCIFAHQEFYNCQMGAYKSTEGEKWPLDNPLIVSGHIHDYDRLQENLIYVGTPIQHGFGDKIDKTISLFKFTKNEFIETRIDLNLIKKVIVSITVDELKTFKPDPNKITKLVIKGDESELKECTKKEEIKKLKSLGVSVSYKHLPKTLNNIETLPIREKYIKRLYDNVKNDETQKYWFNELFSSDMS